MRLAIFGLLIELYMPQTFGYAKRGELISLFSFGIRILRFLWDFSCTNNIYIVKLYFPL